MEDKKSSEYVSSMEHWLDLVKDVIKTKRFM